VIYLATVTVPEPVPDLTADGPASPVTDRRVRRRQEVRRRVYRAAVELFVERGFDATTMDDIAERADVARATVFNHFQIGRASCRERV